MNGYLCIGGEADGQYHNVPYPLKHGNRVRIAPRVLAPVSFRATWVDEAKPVMAVDYVAWGWFQGGDKRTRVYLIPPGWDGFEAMDWLERKAYGGLED